MRETKFRGKVKWNGNHYFCGDWVYGYFYSENDESFFIMDTEEDQYGNIRAEQVEVFPETVGEYTGLKDKNGKEIYEGDILTVIDGLGDNHTEEEVHFVEEWGRWVIGENLTLTSGIAYNCEIVGNIHEENEK